ncbi:putative pentatricopeptide repeat-containing protein [Hordeum vulgare]|nr:putative pentatricopeptide repeat-containing protein [Hordeum vulgare]
MDMPRPCPRPHPTGQPPPPPAPLPACMQGAPRSTAANKEFAHERQLRNHQRVHGLCFKSIDWYSREHRCKQPTQLLTIHVGDHGEVLTDNAIHALELLDEPPPAALDQECCVLSTHIVSGGDAPCTIRLRALVGNQVMLLLVDSGSTYSFILGSFVQRIIAKPA